mgnify:CR=1 FL=1
MNDFIIRGMAANNNIRFFGAETTNLVNNAIKIHNLSITNSVLLGKLMTAAAMMSSELKYEKDALTIKIDGDGPVKTTIATSNNKGHIKGYVSNPQAELEINKKNKKINTMDAIGNGVLTIIKDIGLKKPYNGQVKMMTGEIAKDLTYYFAQSEQIPTSVALGVLIEPDGRVRKAGGLIVQMMPEAEASIIDRLENNLKKLPNVSDLLDMGYSINKILSDIVLKGFDSKTNQVNSIQYKCSCSRNKFKNALKLLKKEELNDMIDKNEPIEMVCHFCNTKYLFKVEELKEIAHKINK